MSDSEQIERLLDLAEAALEGQDPETALELADQAAALEPDNAGALILGAEALRDLQEPELAEQRFRHTIKLYPDHSTAWAGLGILLFDQFVFDHARHCFARAIRADNTNPSAYWGRALLREFDNDLEGARRDYRRANANGGDTWPVPIPLGDEDLVALLEAAAAHLHPEVASYLTQVSVLIQELPDESTCYEYDPPAPPGELLGHFVAGRGSIADGEPWSNLPPALVLYRRNLERAAHDVSSLVHDLCSSLLRDVGDYLGVPESELFMLATASVTSIEPEQEPSTALDDPS